MFCPVVVDVMNIQSERESIGTEAATRAGASELHQSAAVYAPTVRAFDAPSGFAFPELAKAARSPDDAQRSEVET